MNFQSERYFTHLLPIFATGSRSTAGFSGGGRKRAPARTIRLFRISRKVSDHPLKPFCWRRSGSCHFMSHSVEMCSGLSRWAALRVHRGSETFDYELNARGQLAHPAARQRRRPVPFGLPDDPPRSRVARWVGPQELEQPPPRPTQTQDELTGSSLPAPEQYLGFADNCSSAVESGDELIAGDSLYGF
jgi:hypothetical protein